MPLTQEQEDLEHEWNVILMKADTELKTVQPHWEPWKVMISGMTAAAAFGGLVGYLLGLHH